PPSKKERKLSCAAVARPPSPRLPPQVPFPATTVSLPLAVSRRRITQNCPSATYTAVPCAATATGTCPSDNAAPSPGPPATVVMSPGAARPPRGASATAQTSSTLARTTRHRGHAGPRSEGLLCLIF